MSAGSWLVATTKPQRERWAAENAARQGYEYYLPVTEVRVRAPNLKYTYKQQCLFPRYLFVWTDGRWRSLLGTFGITGVVMQGQHPATMPPATIAALKAREDPQGIIQLKKRPESKFTPGTPIRVNDGPFSGCTGIYSSDGPAHRVKVLLEVLGQKATVLIGEDLLEATG